MEATGRRRRWGGAWLAALVVFLSALGGFAGAAIAVVLLDDDDGRSVSTAGVGERAAAIAAPAVVTIIAETAPRGGGSLQVTGLGTGAIIDRRGFVVTNEHVVRGANRLTIVLENGDERRGVVVGHDQPFTDIAVVKLEGDGSYPTVLLGDSDALRLGEPVLAIGYSPGNFHASVASGIVSGLRREWLVEKAILDDLIQTDAAINPGNSGGPLVNMRGEMVGMNTTALYLTSEGDPVTGISLAISAKTIRDVAIPIIQMGRRVRPTIGIEHRDVTPEVAKANGLPAIQAALITAVAPGSPADRSGLRVNDVIIGLGDHDISPDLPYANALLLLPIDRPAAVRFLRDGARLSTVLTPIAR